MIFILIFLLGVVKLERQGRTKNVHRLDIRARIYTRTYIHAHDRSLSARARPTVRWIYAKLWKAQRFSWPKGTSRESVESIYVKFMGATCLSEELGRLKKKKKKKKKKNAWVSSESSRFGV